MSEVTELDEIEVVDLEEYACSDKPIPKRVKYYLVKVDDEKFRIQSPITAKEVLIAADLDPEDYAIEQIFRSGERSRLEPDHTIDLRKPGIERFVSIPKTTITIIINGRQVGVDKRKLSYAELVKLAFDNPPTGPNICFTITYRDGPKKNPKGELVEGESVKIKRGMKFNVTPTDKS